MSNKLNARLWAYIFTYQDLNSDLLKREESNKVYWLQTRISSSDIVLVIYINLAEL